MANETPYLHVYPQGSWHTSAAIVGNRAALTALRDAIDSALNSGEKAQIVSAYAGDGEGFNTFVVYQPGEGRSWDKLMVPYTDDIALDRRKDAKNYFDLIGSERYKALSNENQTR